MIKTFHLSNLISRKKDVKNVAVWLWQFISTAFACLSILFYCCHYQKSKEYKNIQAVRGTTEKPVYYSLPIHRDEHPFSTVKKESNIQKCSIIKKVSC